MSLEIKTGILKGPAGMTDAFAELKIWVVERVPGRTVTPEQIEAAKARCKESIESMLQARCLRINPCGECAGEGFVVLDSEKCAGCKGTGESTDET